ncbi:PucR family transcriptional regulator [Arthrobacter cavernae]|uniref:Helix-turn-helix domain-containing protein n=1 Tax=Arthrobacter cavernae TaxID=2817681 RepID=A0A939HE28_9MICC|nr:helix-turn-helix domain-containing protein [Arthrobacter cavernae]MBO1266650.1 helix-turn-helix domain-containing protein [Arthrobacter cavernae]
MLKSTGLTIRTHGTFPELALLSPSLYDPIAPLETLPGGILLGIGLHPADPRTATVVKEAAEAGFAAIIIKMMSQDIEQLAVIADQSGIALLVVEDEVSWRQLDALLESAVGTVAEANSSLVPLGVGDLFALANAIAAMVGGATTIENLQEQILAYSTLPDQPIDEDRRSGILGRQVPYQPENAGQYASVFRAEGAVHIDGVGDAAMDRLAIAVRAGKQPLGSIWVVDADGTLDAEAKRALESAADIAALHMLRARSSYDLARQQRSELLRRLLESDDDSQLVAEQLALGRTGPFVVVAFEAEVVPGSEEIALARLLDLVSTHCESHRQGTQCVMIGTTIYALFTEARAGSLPLIEGLARRLIDRAAASLHLNLRVSLGTPVAVVNEISRSKYDADRVLLMLAAGERGGTYASAAEMRSRLTLLEVAALFRSRPRLMSPAAEAMVEHDSRADTEYAKTLRTYLDFSCDSAKTAQALSLHQNTLRYRLRRMKEIFGIDPGRPDDMVVLWLSLYVQDLLLAHPSVRRDSLDHG